MIEFLIAAQNLEMAQATQIEKILIPNEVRQGRLAAGAHAMAPRRRERSEPAVSDKIIVEEIALLPTASGENDHTAFQTMCDKTGQYCLRLNRYYDGAEFQTNLTLVEKGTAGTKEYLREEAIEPKASDNRTIGQIYSKIYVITNRQNLNQKNIIFGAIDNRSDMYSGGGANSQVLNLFETEPNGNVVFLNQVLGLPIRGYKMIRACFSENDMRLRRGACHDEYSFDAELKLSGRLQNGRPVFDYKSHATDFPRGASLDNDNSGTRLRKADIVKTINPKCSVRRTFVYDAATKFYKANQTLPDCSDYFY